MTGNSTDVTDLIVQRMNYLNKKSAVHAENIANASTPGYKAREVVPQQSFRDVLHQASVGMKVTDPRHIVPGSMSGANVVTKINNKATASPDGNTVQLDQETFANTKTNLEYQMQTSMLKKFMGLFRIALKTN
jgi:flagellar basal-body rod protein FlgB